jgi:hypothetical protein
MDSMNATLQAAKNPVLLKGTALQAAENILSCLRARLHRLRKNPVSLKGTASAVPQVFYLQWGFSP